MAPGTYRPWPMTGLSASDQIGFAEGRVGKTQPGNWYIIEFQLASAPLSSPPAGAGLGPLARSGPRDGKAASPSVAITISRSGASCGGETEAGLQ